jgi:hypothetical protein
MTETSLAALMKAWKTTMLATTLLVAAVALSRVWDSAVFFRALEDSMTLGEQADVVPETARRAAYGSEDPAPDRDMMLPVARTIDRLDRETATGSLHALAPHGRLAPHG